MTTPTFASEPKVCPECGDVLETKIAEYKGVTFTYRCRCEYAERMRLYSEIEEEEKKQKIRRIFEGAKIPKRYAGLDIQDFDLSRPGAKDVVQKVLQYIEDINGNVKEGKGMVLWGGTGTGKTLLAVAILKAAMNRGYTGLFQSAPELMYHFNSVYSTAETEQNIIDALRSVDVLVLDDLDKGKWTEKVAERIYVIINARYGEVKPTLITTNLDPRALLELVGEAIFDRIRESSTFVALSGESFRKKKATGGK